MTHLDFTTSVFRDTKVQRETNVNGIEGATLASMVREHLIVLGYSCEVVFDEDFGWAFYATSSEGRYFCTFSMDPVNDEEDRDTAVAMYGNVHIGKVRSLVQKVLGKNRQSPTEALPLAVNTFFEVRNDVSNLKAQH